MRMSYAYRFILYFVLAVKENKDPACIGDYIHFHRYSKHKKALFYSPRGIKKGEHPYKNLMKRCGLRPGYTYSQGFRHAVALETERGALEEGFYMELIATNNDKKALEKIKQRWNHVSIASLVAAHSCMGDELFYLALEYVRRTDKLIS